MLPLGWDPHTEGRCRVLSPHLPWAHPSRALGGRGPGSVTMTAMGHCPSPWSDPALSPEATRAPPSCASLHMCHQAPPRGCSEFTGLIWSLWPLWAPPWALLGEGLWGPRSSFFSLCAPGGHTPCHATADRGQGLELPSPLPRMGQAGVRAGGPAGVLGHVGKRHLGDEVVGPPVNWSHLGQHLGRQAGAGGEGAEWTD